MKSYSVDLRIRVTTAYHDGEGTYKELAQRFVISEASVGRWLKELRETGELSPSRAKRGPKPKFHTENQSILRNLVEQKPDALLREYQQKLQELWKLQAHPTTICRALNRYGLTRKKKTLKADERDREDVKKEREVFFEKISAFKPEDLFVLDESGVNTAMTRTHSRSPKGERAYGSAPRNWGKNITMLGVISLSGITTGMTIQGGMNGVTFLTFIQKWLCPLLKPGQVVIMDNLSAHKVKGIEQAIEAVGAQVQYLPPYSPDFSPIEQMWSKIKSYLKGVEARTREELEKAISEGFDLVTQEDIRGWFRHCGYRTQ